MDRFKDKLFGRKTFMRTGDTVFNSGAAATPLPQPMIWNQPAGREKRLLFAVLDKAVADLLILRRGENRHRVAHVDKNVAEWFASGEDYGLMSYVSICHHLGIDACYLRDRLLDTELSAPR